MFPETYELNFNKLFSREQKSMVVAQLNPQKLSFLINLHISI
jgi:hypothetical protein